MDPFSSSKATINMDGGNDLHYRYKMPIIIVKHEGKGKMKKSVLLNIKEVCESIGRPPDYLMTYLGQKLSAMAKVEKDVGLSYVTGHHDAEQVQKEVLDFIRDVVMCRKCHHNPETSCHTEGSKKQQVFFLRCKGCGKRSDLDSTDRFVKYMISHHAEEANYGHAACTTNIALTAESTTKKECPKCHHKTSKSMCTKCGSQTVDVTLKETADDGPKRRVCPGCGHKTSKPVCSKCDSQIEDDYIIASEPTSTVEVTQKLVASLKFAMTDMAASQSGILTEDLLAHLKKEGFDGLAPLDLLGAVVAVIADTVCNLSAIDTTKLQPITVATEARPVVALWSVTLEELSSEAEDAEAVADTVIAKVQEGVSCTLPTEAFSVNGDCMVVGLLLALKAVNGLATGLLEGCRRLPVRSPAMNKFMDFLAAEEDEEEEDDDEEEDHDNATNADGDEGGSGAV